MKARSLADVGRAVAMRMRAVRASEVSWAWGVGYASVPPVVTLVEGGDRRKKYYNRAATLYNQFVPIF